jgi:hypothetical protein
MVEQISFLDGPQHGEFPLENARYAHCKSCNAPIAWTKTSEGAAIPLDLAHVTQYDGKRYAVTHFAYCPHGAHWRRKK